ncbi:hypothetical protein SGRIM128S_04538 [Streptomyces griseomycini]|nr:hypothetical protein GCM10015536_65550 [Streptomyces griseomycini]
MAGGLLATDPGPRLSALGAYVGETARHGLGGTREADGEDPHDEVDIALRLPASRPHRLVDDRGRDAADRHTSRTRLPVLARDGTPEGRPGWIITP